jgi:hypothetical protein
MTFNPSHGLDSLMMVEARSHDSLKMILQLYLSPD